MKIGLIDVDGHNFPNLPLMKISAFYKGHGDTAEFYDPLEGQCAPYDKVYISKVFTFTADYQYPIYADEIISGGTGYDISEKLPPDMESVMPDYSLYPRYSEAYGFLTRGCPRQCKFCIVGQKEGVVSRKVSDLSGFWNGQKSIKLLDPNLLACRDRISLLEQLIDSQSWIDFTQGLDIRLMTEEITDLIMKCKKKMIHFAWDSEKDSALICEKLRAFKKQTGIDRRKAGVYVLTNFNTSFAFDLYRVYEIRSMGFDHTS